MRMVAVGRHRIELECLAQETRARPHALVGLGADHRRRPVRLAGKLAGPGFFNITHHPPCPPAAGSSSLHIAVHLASGHDLPWTVLQHSAGFVERIRYRDCAPTAPAASSPISRCPASDLVQRSMYIVIHHDAVALRKSNLRMPPKPARRGREDSGGGDTGQERTRNHPDRRRGCRRLGRGRLQSPARCLWRQRRPARPRPGLDRQLGYRPHAAARGMRGQTYTLGFLIPDLRNPFFCRHPGRRERRAGAHPVPDPPRRQRFHRPRSRLALLDAMMDRQMDGIMVIGPRIPFPELAQIAERIPLVLIAYHAKPGAISTPSTTTTASARRWSSSTSSPPATATSPSQPGTRRPRRMPWSRRSARSASGPP